MKLLRSAALIALMLGIAGPALAQSTDPHHPSGDAPAPGGPSVAQDGEAQPTSEAPSGMGGMPAECRAAMRSLPPNCKSMMMQMMDGGMPMEGMSGAMRGNAEAMRRMQGAMTEAMREADPDVAFVKGMIPHHQAAIDMAQVVLEEGNDPQTKM